jgi:hypothetical protein
VIPRVLATLAPVLAPAPAAACAVCLDSAFGDRGFHLAFVALMLAPFAVAAGGGAVLMWLRAGRRRPDPAVRSEEGDRC